jgi:hypothetical protein
MRSHFNYPWTWRSAGLLPSKTEPDAEFMTDLIYVGIVVAFFVVSGVYVRFCEKM